MKNILNEEKIDMSYQNNEIDFENIKKMTFLKIKSSKPKLTALKKSLLAVASFALIITLGGVTVYATGSPEIRGFINEILGLPAGDILYVGESVSNEDYTVTILDVAYDGVSGKIYYSVSPISDSAKESFDEYDGKKLFKTVNFSSGASEMYEYQNKDTKLYEYSFHTRRDDEVFSEMKIIFEDFNNYIIIPLENTLDSTVIDIFVPETDYSKTRFTKLHYSKLGFTLFGESDLKTTKFSELYNQEIDFVMKNGDILNIRTNDKDAVIFFSVEYSETANQYFDENGNTIFEQIFRFRQSFDWTLVDKIIVNDTEIDIK